MSFFKKIISLFKLMKNYRKLAVKKTLLIYIYTNPLIYLFLLIITKIIIQTKNNFLKKQKYNFYFDQKISDRIFDRISYDKALIKRHVLVSYIAILLRKSYFDKLIFNFFRVPFPYLKLIIKN